MGNTTNSTHEVRKPILCLDFDGVLHTYSRGWQGGEIYDPATPGFFSWAQIAKDHFTLVVYSSRSSSYSQVVAMQAWLRKEARTWILIVIGHEPTEEELNRIMEWFEFSATKPPAVLTIDDRAIQFQGRWDDPQLQPYRLTLFKPWNSGESGA